MKRPSRIRILGKRFEVSYIAPGEPPLMESDMGEIDCDKQTIAVSDGLPLENEQDTVLHEVLHGVENAMGLDLDEAAIRSLATGLLAVIKDNRGFVSYLRADKR